MIIFGYSTKQRALKTLHTQCPVCNDQKVQLMAYTKVFDIFWVPCFPFKTDHAVFCPNCKSHFELTGFNIDPVSLKVSKPLYYFAGLVLLPILIAAGFASNTYLENNSSENTYVDRKSVRTGDIIVFKSSNSFFYPYYLGKVTEVGALSITAVFSKYQYKYRFSALRAANHPKDRDFEQKTYTIDKKEFENLTNIEALLH
jgi:hypothetical protein